MTVQELIDELMKIEDKNMKVKVPEFYMYTDELKEVCVYGNEVNLFTI